MIRLGTQGMDGLKRGLGEARDLGAAGLGEIVRTGTAATVREVVRASGSVGRVAAGVTVKLTGSGIDTVGRVALAGAAIPAATGAQPHVIKPRRKALRFGGRFAHHVKHPGSAPNDFFERGVKKAIVTIEADMAALGEVLVETIADDIQADRRVQ